MQNLTMAPTRASLVRLCMTLMQILTISFAKHAIVRLCMARTAWRTPPLWCCC